MEVPLLGAESRTDGGGLSGWKSWKPHADKLAAMFLGEDSPESHRQAIELSDSILPNSRGVLFPGQQHLAHHMNPEVLAEKVLHFLVG